MRKYGTNHFVDRRAAWNYFKIYGYNKEDINDMIQCNQIKIGPPELKSDEELEINEENRYVIRIKEKEGTTRLE